jgi:hypothetical protein
MDDILILAPTRWKLKRAIGVLNETFDELKLEKHLTRQRWEGQRRGLISLVAISALKDLHWLKRR